MKKFLAMMLALIMVLSLWACGKDAEGGDQTTKPAPEKPGSETPNVQDTPVGYAMTVKGVTFGVGMNAETVAEKLGAGEPVVTESCGDMGGDDYDYDCGDFVIYANNGGGAVRIYCVEIISDLVSTPEGVALCDEAADVKAAYGDPTSETGSCLTYEKDGMELRFFLDEGGQVSSIQYYG